MAFSQTLRRLREAAQLTQEHLALAIGISKSAISMYEQGNRQPDFETLETIADYFNVDMNVLLGRKHNHPYEPYSNTSASWGDPILKAYASAVRPTQDAACAVLGIPHVDPDPLFKPQSSTCDMLVYTFPAAAGMPLSAEGDYERIEFPESQVPCGSDFGIRIRGDSMLPTIKDGTIVFVRKQPEMRNGQLGIFMIDDEALCKRFYRMGNNICLKSDNPAYKDIKINEYQRFYIVGKVLGYR